MSVNRCLLTLFYLRKPWRETEPFDSLSAILLLAVAFIISFFYSFTFGLV